MLHKETVDRELFELTKVLCAQPLLEQFLLVGGTSLSLHLGHRKSIDIDLFSSSGFDTEEMVLWLSEQFDYENQNRFKNSLLGSIRNIKVDIISHQYQWLQPPIVEEGIRMASMEDIAAMKLNAIMGNGSRLKDYVDIAYLSTVFTLQQMLNFFEKKYPHNNAMIAYKSLSWFEDINFSVDINYMNKEMTWERIHGRIVEMLHQPQLIFPDL